MATAAGAAAAAVRRSPTNPASHDNHHHHGHEDGMIFEEQLSKTNANDINNTRRSTSTAAAGPSNYYYHDQPPPLKRCYETEPWSTQSSSSSAAGGGEGSEGPGPSHNTSSSTSTRETTRHSSQQPSTTTTTTDQWYQGGNSRNSTSTSSSNQPSYRRFENDSNRYTSASNSKTDRDCYYDGNRNNNSTSRMCNPLPPSSSSSFNNNNNQRQDQRQRGFSDRDDRPHPNARNNMKYNNNGEYENGGGGGYYNNNNNNGRYDQRLQQQQQRSSSSSYENSSSQYNQQQRQRGGAGAGAGRYYDDDRFGGVGGRDGYGSSFRDGGEGGGRGDSSYSYNNNNNRDSGQRWNAAGRGGGGGGSRNIGDGYDSGMYNNREGNNNYSNRRPEQPPYPASSYRDDRRSAWDDGRMPPSSSSFASAPSLSSGRNYDNYDERGGRFSGYDDLERRGPSGPPPRGGSFAPARSEFNNGNGNGNGNRFPRVGGQYGGDRRSVDSSPVPPPASSMVADPRRRQSSVLGGPASEASNSFRYDDGRPRGPYNKSSHDRDRQPSLPTNSNSRFSAAAEEVRGRNLDPRNPSNITRREDLAATSTEPASFAKTETMQSRLPSSSSSHPSNHVAVENLKKRQVDQSVEVDRSPPTKRSRDEGYAIPTQSTASASILGQHAVPAESRKSTLSVSSAPANTSNADSSVRPATVVPSTSGPTIQKKLPLPPAAAKPVAKKNRLGIPLKWLKPTATAKPKIPAQKSLLSSKTPKVENRYVAIPKKGPSSSSSAAPKPSTSSVSAKQQLCKSSIMVTDSSEGDSTMSPTHELNLSRTVETKKPSKPVPEAIVTKTKKKKIKTVTNKPTKRDDENVADQDKIVSGRGKKNEWDSDAESQSENDSSESEAENDPADLVPYRKPGTAIPSLSSARPKDRLSSTPSHAMSPPSSPGAGSNDDGELDQSASAKLERRRQRKKEKEARLLAKVQNQKTEFDHEKAETEMEEERRKREEARPLTEAEIKAILGEEDCIAGAPCQGNWVRRSARQPSTALLQSKHMQSLITKLKTNSPDMVVLKLKKYCADPNAPSAVLDAILDALEENSNCEALYIQNFNEGMRDEQVLHLVRILQQRKCKIWCLNIGENYNVSDETWEKFTKGLIHTKVTHMYASEHTITTEMKDEIRTTIRENRKKHTMHIDPANLNVIVQCTHCWWNPVNAKVLRPYLQKQGLEGMLNDKEAQGHRGSSSTAPAT